MKQLLQFAIAASALLFTGCSAFNYEWRQATRKPVPANDIAGPWEGRWISKATGHEDKLRALITSVDPNNYDVKFHAAYKSETFKFITVHFGYTVRMETQPGADQNIAFRGSEDLGALAGGIYTYEGSASATNFFSTYKSKYDHGTFELKRPVN
ncbi:MAG: hypothetical protein H7Y43_16900 [Akkermansiaceae bacterium]|nr:hypothetical protein [Verrucomicrobiales bacterium]